MAGISPRGYFQQKKHQLGPRVSPCPCSSKFLTLTNPLGSAEAIFNSLLGLRSHMGTGSGVPSLGLTPRLTVSTGGPWARR